MTVKERTAAGPEGRGRRTVETEKMDGQPEEIRAPITVVGAYRRGNLGDDLLMLAVLAALRSACPTERVLVLTRGSLEYSARWRPDCAFRSYPAGPAVVRTRLLVYGGGTQFFSFRGGGMRSVRRPLVDRLRRAAGAVARRAGLLAPVGKEPTIEADAAAAFCIGLGPFAPGLDGEAEARRKLSRCGYLAVRDEASLQYCRRWGLGGAVLRPDPCYSSRLNDLLPPAGKPGERIGIIVRDWTHSPEGAAYLEPLLQAARALRQAGYGVRYFSFNRDYDPYTAGRLERHGERVLGWHPAEEAPRDFIRELSRMRLLVTARAHGAVLGARLRRPIVCVEIEPKLRAMAEQIGEGAALWEQPFEKRRLVETVERMLAKRREITNALTERTGELTRAADRAVDELAEFAAAKVEA